MSDELELDAAVGVIEPNLRAEFPGLTIRWVTVEGRVGPAPPELKRRLRALSNRYRGASVVTMRTQPIPHAYRAFYRHIGLDPDVDRVPSEEAAVGRLLHGGLRSRDLVADALLIALVETAVPVWALDADLVQAGGLGIRATVEGERLGTAEDARPLAPGTLVVADAERVHGLLFGELAREHAPGPATTRLALFTVGVDGVPPIHLEEALWLAAEMLRAA